MSRAQRIGAAAMATFLACPPAMAAGPGLVDDALLPRPHAPAPPNATELSGSCRYPTDSADTATVGQLDELDLPALHRLSTGSGQLVAVIDTGVARHQRLPRLVAGGDYVSTGDGTQDCDGHGTLVAGIIAAAPVDDDPLPFVGVAPDAGVIAIRQSSNEFRVSDERSGTGVGDVDTLAMAVRTAADLGATVINISMVACAPAGVGIDDRPLGAALKYAVDVKNVVIVAAAGNVEGRGRCEGRNPAGDPAHPARPDWDDVEVVVSPAWYDDYVLTVGSIGSDGAPSTFTMAGPWVDVAAPGEAVRSLAVDGASLIDDHDGEPISGTSYAAPIVSGLAALIRARTPHLTARQVMRLIEDTARHPSAGWNPFVGSGVVDPLAALSTHGEASDPVGAPAVLPAASPPPPPPGTSRAVALGGAAVCLAAVVAVMLSAGRLRRREKPVAHD